MLDCDEPGPRLAGPDFLGIGGTRCGSSWLYTNLKAHPEVWLPPRKELHYFDRALAYNSPSHLADASPITRWVSREQHNKEFRRRAAAGIAKSVFKPEQLAWNLTYFFGQYDDDWYASLFKAGKDKVKGEITPAYSILAPEDVEKIRNVMPGVKIIFIIRNPIDRTWSGLRKTEMATLPEQELAGLLNGRFARSDYVRTISVWRQYFPSDQLYIGFFDDITENPEKFLLALFGFLGVSADTGYVPADVRAKVNASRQQEIPRGIRMALARKFVADLEELSDMVGGHAEKWLADAQSVLRGA